MASWAPWIWPSVMLSTSAPTCNRSFRGSIPSRLRIAAHHLPVYASPLALPPATQHSVPGALPGLPGLGSSPSCQSRAWLGALATEQLWKSFDNCSAATQTPGYGGASPMSKAWTESRASASFLLSSDRASSLSVDLEREVALSLFSSEFFLPKKRRRRGVARARVPSF